MRDAYGRIIDYLRVSITDRCNFRCSYCLPRANVKWLEHPDILTYEEILRLIRIFCGQGIRKVRITGGEPLVRKGAVKLVRAIAGLGMINDISMTTNGSLLAGLAADLKQAGLDRVNISLDTVDPERFAQITAGGCLQDTLHGIYSALDAGLHPVKLNVVLTEALGKKDIAFFIDHVYRFPLYVRFIEYMPLGAQNANGPLAPTVKSRLESAGFGPLAPVAPPGGNGPARYYRLAGAKGAFGFITPLSEHFCHYCNRLRLTADGKLKPCLLAGSELDIKTPMRSGANDDELACLYMQAVRLKPKGHCVGEEKTADVGRCMFQIGG